jgi:hypothetical protein
MPRRNSERKINRTEAASPLAAPGVTLLVWRKCPMCHWEMRSIESPDANPLCPRCHSLMERQAVAPADSYEKKDLDTAVSRRATSVPDLSRKRAKPRR